MKNKDNFDIVVIGAGPGGYVAAIKAALKGKKVALIEKSHLGGTCLNVGCIPTKTLIANAQILEKIAKASQFGINIKDYSFDYSKMKERKDNVVETIRKSLGSLLKSHGIHVFFGGAKFLSPKEIKISGEEKKVLKGDKIIIATGSTTLDIKAFPCDHKNILNSTSILEMSSLPKSLIVVGGGYIGSEFASLFAEMGVKVTILEALDSIVKAQGASISNFLTKKFKDKGISIKTSVKVSSIESFENSATVHLENGDTLSADKVLISIGRKIVSDNLDITKAGLKTNANGSIDVDERMQTEVPGIYAIGDVTGKAMLAHVASHQGIVAATNATGGNALMHYHAVPAVIFTLPEVAVVGMTLEEALQKNYKAKAGAFPFQALGKSQATMDTEGFAQVIFDEDTHEILGAQVIGHDASALIGEMALAIQNELTLECITETIHAHPTVAEAWLEAALIANDTPIHFPPKLKK